MCNPNQSKDDATSAPLEIEAQTAQVKIDITKPSISTDKLDATNIPLNIDHPQLVVIASFWMFFAALGALYTGGLFILPIATSLSTSRSSASYIPSIFVSSLLACCYSAGRLHDNLSHSQLVKDYPSATALPYAIGGIICGLGLLFLSLSNSILAACISALLVGCGASLFSIPSVTMVQSWFDIKSRATMTGRAMAGAGAGQYVFAVVLNILINHFNEDGCFTNTADNGTNEIGAKLCEGWRSALKVESLVVATIAVLFCGLIKKKSDEIVVLPSPTPSLTDSGDSLYSLENASAIFKFNPSLVKAQVDMTFTDCLKSRPYQQLIFFKVCFSLGYLTIFLHITPHAEDVGLSSDDAATLLSLIGAASICGRILLGILADKVGTKNCLSYSMFILVACMLIWPYCTTFPTLAVLSLVFGFLAGGFPSLPPSIVTEYYGKRANSNFFAVLGFLFVVEAPGAFVGGPIAGALFDKFGDYYAASYCAAAPMFIGNCMLHWMVNSKDFNEEEDRKEANKKIVSDEEAGSIL